MEELPSTDFLSFSHLPYELRNQIWREAISDQRRIYLRLTTDLDHRGTPMDLVEQAGEPPTINLPVLGVCRESRAIALPVLDRIVHFKVQRVTYANFSSDIFVCSGADIFSNALWGPFEGEPDRFVPGSRTYWNVPRRDLAKIRHLVVRVRGFESVNFKVLLRVLDSLERIDMEVMACETMNGGRFSFENMYHATRLQWVMASMQEVDRLKGRDVVLEIYEAGKER